MISLLEKLPSLHKIAKSKLFQNTSLVLVSNIISRAFGLAVFILIARYLPIGKYSALTLILAIIVTLTDLVTSGLSASVIRYTAIYKSKHEHNKISILWSTSLINAIGISVLIICVVYLLRKPINALFIKDGNYQTELLLAAFGIATTYIFSVYAGVIQGAEKFGSFLTGSLIFAVVRFICAGILILVGHLEIFNIVLLFVIAPIPAIIFLHIRLSQAGYVKFGYNKMVLKETLAYGQWMMLWSVTTVIQSKFDLYMQGAVATPEQVSYFDIASKVISIPLTFLTSIGMALNPRLASLQIEELPKMVKRLTTFSIFSSIGVSVGAVLIFQVLLVYLGPTYYPSLIPVLIMSLGLIFISWNLPFTSAIFSIGKSKVFFVASLAGLFANIVTSIILVPKTGCIGSAISFAVANSVAFAVTFGSYRALFSRGKCAQQ